MESGHKVVNVTLAIQKPFRNEENEYETDYIPVQAWMRTAEIVCDYIGKGSILGCKCRLQTRVIEINEKKYRTIDVIAERISFISTKQRSDKTKENVLPENDMQEEIIISECDDKYENEE